MFALLETQRALATVAVFLGTFFLTLSIGRLLKRRAGVRFGIFFQLFALTLASYAAAGVYGLDRPWRDHAGALLVLLGTGVFIGLLDRYLWDLYFERKRQTPIPKFLRQVVAIVIFLVAMGLVLNFGYHAQKSLTGLIATSSVTAVVIGFAAQNLLGGFIASLSLQISRPYRVGDWLQVGEHFAEVMEINWRSTRLRTNDAIYLDVPNNEIVRQTIINLHYPQQLHAMRIVVGAEYGAAPNRVKDALLRATLHADGVQHEPPPKIYLKDFGDFAIGYEIKFWMLNHQAYNDICDAIRTNVWYEFKRQKITIPFPIRTLEVKRRPMARPQAEQDKARAILATEPLFECLNEEQLDALIHNGRMVHFGRGESVIEQGAEGESMFVLVDGTAQVSVAQNGAAIRVGILRAGDCFGEMSLLTGERRTATVRAEHDCEVFEISKPVMAALLRDAPECVSQLSTLLAKRKMETEGLVKDATEAGGANTKETEYRTNFLRRVRAFFEL